MLELRLEPDDLERIPICQPIAGKLVRLKPDNSETIPICQPIIEKLIIDWFNMFYYLRDRGLIEDKEEKQ